MEKINIGTYYFQVDSKFLSDVKIRMMVNDLSYSSISIYIVVLCWLYDLKGVLNKSHYTHIAKQLDCDVELVRKVVEDYDLFYFEGDEFSSHRARKDMQTRAGFSKGGKISKKNGNLSN